MKDRLAPDVVTLPEILKAAGFHLSNVGKLFHELEYAPKQYAAFDRIERYAHPPGWQGPPPILTFPPVRNSQPHDPAPKDEKIREYREWKRRRSDRYGDSGLVWEDHGDYRMAAAAAILRDYAANQRRFFLSVSPSRPHTPLTAPRKFLDLYDPARIPDPPAPVSTLKELPYMKRATGANPDIFTERQPTPQQAREAIAAYYACLTMVDANIGMILRALEEIGLDATTIVVFLGDHGFHLGDHGFWSKYSMLEATHRAPLVIRVPGAPGNGQLCPGFVEFIDLLPTLCELAGVTPPAGIEGFSFVPLFEDPGRPWKTAVFITEGDSEIGDGVRTGKYRYLEFEKGEMPAALFDLENDPWGTRNVVNDPAYATVRAEMAALLKVGWRAALPTK